MFNSILKKKIENEISKKINLEKSFEENKLDSLDLITLVSIIEDEFKKKISEKSLKNIKNFNQLYKSIKNAKKIQFK
jgi:acyl carrier protein